MKTVNELSQEIIGEFREQQKSRLQRTFVGGTDAASAKANGKFFFIKRFHFQNFPLESFIPCCIVCVQFFPLVFLLC
jgi:hypothetical protein